MRPTIFQSFALVIIAISIGCDRPAAQSNQPPAIPSKSISSTATSKQSAPSANIDWKQYPKSDAFESFKSRHLKHESLPEFGEPLILITWFQSKAVGLEYTVDTSGRKWDCRIVYNWAAQDSQTGQVEGKQLENLADVVRLLPESSANPPLDRLVLVTRRVGDHWRTDAYDANHLPDALEDVFSIIGERFETRDRVRKNAKEETTTLDSIFTHRISVAESQISGHSK